MWKMAKEMAPSNNFLFDYQRRLVSSKFNCYMSLASPRRRAFLANKELSNVQTASNCRRTDFAGQCESLLLEIDSYPIFTYIASGVMVNRRGDVLRSKKPISYKHPCPNVSCLQQSTHACWVLASRHLENWAVLRGTGFRWLAEYL